jgi:hypothetical protein
MPLDLRFARCHYADHRRFRHCLRFSHFAIIFDISLFASFSFSTRHYAISIIFIRFSIFLIAFFDAIFTPRFSSPLRLSPFRRCRHYFFR